jgi:Peptidase MA superfamily
LKSRFVLASLALLVGFCAFGSPALPHAKAAGIEVRSDTAQSRFPDGIQFSIFLESDSDITDVRLKYRVLPDGTLSFARGQCTTGRVANCNATVGATRASYLVPGATVVYNWEIQDASSNRLDSPEKRVTYDDARFKWESIRDGNITVFYYFGEEPKSALQTARQTIDRVSALDNTRIEFPLKIWVYQNNRDMQPAVASRQAPNVVVEGEVSTSDTAIVSREQDFLNTLRHELAHVVMRRATRSNDPVGENYVWYDVPDWINEGQSVYVQTRAGQFYESSLDQAIKTNRVLPITSLSAGAASAAGVGLFYGESGSIVKFLVETYGDAKFAQLIAALKNNGIDEAFKQAYGFDRLGLENAWRKSIGLPQVEASAPSASSNERPLPTIIPFGSQGSSGSNSATPQPGSSGTTATSESKDGSSSTPIIIGVVAAAVLVLGAGGFFFIRRRGSSSAPPPA